MILNILLEFTICIFSLSWTCVSEKRISSVQSSTWIDKGRTSLAASGWTRVSTAYNKFINGTVSESIPNNQYSTKDNRRRSIYIPEHGTRTLTQSDAMINSSFTFSNFQNETVEENSSMKTPSLQPTEEVINVTESLQPTLVTKLNADISPVPSPSIVVLVMLTPSPSSVPTISVSPSDVPSASPTNSEAPSLPGVKLVTLTVPPTMIPSLSVGPSTSNSIPFTSPSSNSPSKSPINSAVSDAYATPSNPTPTPTLSNSYKLAWPSFSPSTIKPATNTAFTPSKSPIRQSVGDSTNSTSNLNTKNSKASNLGITMNTKLSTQGLVLIGFLGSLVTIGMFGIVLIYVFPPSKPRKVKASQLLEEMDSSMVSTDLLLDSSRTMFLQTSHDKEVTSPTHTELANTETEEDLSWLKQDIL